MPGGQEVTLYCQAEAGNKTFERIGYSHEHGSGNVPNYQTGLYRCTSCGFVRAYPPKVASDP